VYLCNDCIVIVIVFISQEFSFSCKAECIGLRTDIEYALGVGVPHHYHDSSLLLCSLCIVL